MEFNHAPWIILLIGFLFSGCSSPPKPPVVDGTTRQLINDEETIENMTCPVTFKNRFQKKREQPVISSPRSQTVCIHFPFNDTHFRLNTAESKQLLFLIAKAHHINLRGRTDAQYPSIADEKIALNRALAAQRYLIEQGASPALISVNYLSAGDYIADNASTTGRIKNRRVDIEVFQ